MGIFLGLLVAVATFLGARLVLWLFGKMPFVLIFTRTPDMLAGIAVVALFGSAIWTAAQWMQGSSFD